MKRIITLLSASAVMLSAVSCSKVEQSTLSSETLPVKITVTGHVRSIATDSDGLQEEPMVVKSGTKVNVMYGLPDDEGNVEFALKTVSRSTARSRAIPTPGTRMAITLNRRPCFSQSLRKRFHAERPSTLHWTLRRRPIPPRTA